MNSYHCYIGADWKGPLSWEKLLKLCKDGTINADTLVSLNGKEGQPASVLFGDNWAKMSPAKPPSPVQPPPPPPPVQHQTPHQHHAPPPAQSYVPQHHTAPYATGNTQSVNVTTQVVQHGGGSGGGLIAGAIIFWLIAAFLLMFALLGFIGSVANAHDREAPMAFVCSLLGFGIPGLVFLALGFVCFHYGRKSAGRTTIYHA